MKGIVNIIGLLLLLVACTQKKKDPVNVYDPENFIRVTSDADSAKEMRVTYLFRVDAKRTMMRMYFNDGSLLAVGNIQSRENDK